MNRAALEEKQITHVVLDGTAIKLETLDELETYEVVRTEPHIDRPLRPNTAKVAWLKRV